MAKKKKVVILGAGPSGLAAAFGLSDTPKLREEYDITVYQVGWRAGGKCSTGRAGPANRIEQNGTHYLFGCYDNCFDMAKRSYEELKARGIEWFGSYEEAFLPRDLLVFKQFFNGQWHVWPIEFPSNSTEPGTRDGALPLSNYLSMILQALVEAEAGWRVLRAIKPPGPFSPGYNKPGLIRALLRPVGRLLAGAVNLIGGWMLSLVWNVYRRLIAGTWLERVALKTIEWFCRAVRRAAWWLLGRRVETSLRANRLFTLVDFGCTVVIGLIADNVLRPGGLGAIDRYEFREWLERHGSREITRYAPFVNTWYDAVAAYEDGNLDRPNLAADVSLYAISLALFFYKGAFAYQMRAEIGDSFIGPIFQCLRERGVKFRFFHRVWDLIPNDKDEIEEIVVEQQVELKSGDPDSYDPFMTVKGLKAWPNQPCWKQIKDPDKVKGVDLESFYTPVVGHKHPLKQGRDYDIVVLALPVDCLRFYCPRIVEKKTDWQAMIDNVEGVETQSIRLWFAPTLKKLGWKYGPPILSSYAKPFSTWEDNGHLVEAQTWPADQMPHAMATVFGALPAPHVSPGHEDADYPRLQQAKADAAALLFMEHDVGPLWPGATRPENPLAVDWDLLIDLENRQGPDRLKSQYVRANAGPVERYTMAKAGRSRYRLRTDESGFTNLYLAGDWTRNGFIIGSVEGAMIGGLQTSRAICGHPERIPSEVRQL